MKGGRTIGQGILLIALLLSYARGQEVSHRLIFASDSFFVAQAIIVTLQVQHNPGTGIIFHKDRELFAPFDLISIRPLETTMEDGYLVDACEFELRTFDLYPKRVLSIPYDWYSPNDTIRYTVESDTLFLRELVTVVPDSLSFHSSEGLIAMEDPPNYTLYFLGGIALLVLLTLASFILHKPFFRFLQAQRIRREWKGVKKEIKAIEAIDTNPSEFITRLNHLWKVSFDPDDEHSLLSMTTTELRQSLREKMDRMGEMDRQLLISVSFAADRILYAGEELGRGELHELSRTLTGLLWESYHSRIRKVMRSS